MYSEPKGGGFQLGILLTVTVWVCGLTDVEGALGLGLPALQKMNKLATK